MTDTTAVATRDQVATIVRALQDAWNAADAPAFAAPFAEDADFVNVYGMLARGREAIQQGHAAILAGPYAGSTIAYTPESVRLLRPGVAVAHVHAVLVIPGGPMAGEHQARWSAVLTGEGGRWEIASFHNTFITTPGGPRR
jgi:uncharacterized protein (TIGR02246 family)